MQNVVDLEERRRERILDALSGREAVFVDRRYWRELRRLRQAHYLLTGEWTRRFSQFDACIQSVMLEIGILQWSTQSSPIRLDLMSGYNPSFLIIMTAEINVRAADPEAFFANLPRMTPKLKRFVKHVHAHFDRKRFPDLVELLTAHLVALAMPRWTSHGILVKRTQADGRKVLDLSDRLKAQTEEERSATAAALTRPELSYDLTSQRWFDRKV